MNGGGRRRAARKKIKPPSPSLYYYTEEAILGGATCYQNRLTNIHPARFDCGDHHQVTIESESEWVAASVAETRPKLKSIQHLKIGNTPTDRPTDPQSGDCSGPPRIGFYRDSMTTAPPFLTGFSDVIAVTDAPMCPSERECQAVSSPVEGIS